MGPRKPPDRGPDSGQDELLVPVRYRPRLLDGLMDDHVALRSAMLAILDAARGRDEDARILSLQRFAKLFRQVCLTKSVQVYPYLRWVLQHDAMARLQLKAVDADVQRCTCAMEAMLSDYLGAPWLNERRRRLLTDVVPLARLLADALRLEESTVFPLYATPGQFHYARAPEPA